VTKRRGGWLILGLVLAASITGGSAASSPSAVPPPSPISIYFETQLPYFYEGDNIPVAMTVKNVSDGPVDNSQGLDLLGGFQVEDAKGTKLKPAEGSHTLVSQPKALEKSAFFGRVLPLEEIFPGLKKAGNYKVSWKGAGADSNTLILHVVSRYDPKKNYRARLETDFGPIVIDLDKDSAPRHVRNFVDLARQGFYNGNQFHRILPGVAIVGGSPTGDPTAGAGYNLDPEPSRTPMEAGTVVQVRNRETGAMDSGSHFMILAIAKPDLTGQMSVLGKVVEGMDTVKTICQVPTARRPDEPAGMPERPVKPILIKKVTLTEVAESAPPKTGEAKPASPKAAAGKN